ncbi:MAG: TMEM165/GDT1 family protein, partial [Novosphingobium sp.]|nr:TMEM165/GDT1 family protein [Novosphingobium sp.]
MLEALFTSTAIVALAEIGDKTQLLAIVLAARFKRPAPIVLGILVATLANHFLAALAGSLAAGWFDGPAFRYAVAVGFLAMAAWTLVPDTFDDDEAPAVSRGGAFLTTLVAFFLVEMGDKTQVATIALGARFHDALSVTAGTTLGMMLANVPAVLLGGELVKRVPLGAVRTIAALFFAVLGALLLLATEIGRA